MMSGIKERIARIEPATADRLLAAAMILGLAAETAAFADSDPGRVAASAGLAVALATLVVRRSRPLIPLVSILAANFTMAALEPGLFGTIAFPFLGLMVAIYSTARHTPGSEGVWYCVAAVLIAAPASLLHEDIPGPTQFLWLLVLGGAPAVVGRTLLNRRNIQDELRARTQELERESEVRASHAIEDERVRIAGELQAVVANGVSAMVVQAEAVPRVIAAGQMERAAESLGADRGDRAATLSPRCAACLACSAVTMRRAILHRSPRSTRPATWSSAPMSSGWRWPWSWRVSASRCRSESISPPTA